MKFVIAVDCEGLACVVGAPGGTFNKSRNYAFACAEATREANAAARALFDAGAERVIVWDNHDGSLNMDYTALDERMEITLGVGFPHRFPGMDETFAVDAAKVADGSARENFWVSRARVDIRWTPQPSVLARWHVDAVQTRLRTYDAYLELKSGEGTFAMGQFKVPLMEEVLESASVLLTPERSRAAEALFPGNRDRGIALTWRKEGMPTITLVVLSGTRARDTGDSLTSRKSWLVRIVQPLGKFGQAWVGMIDGKGRADTNNDETLDITYDRERKLIGLLLIPIDPLSLRAEWVFGKGCDRFYSPATRVRGGYVQVSYRLPKLPLTLYAKRDEFDPNRDQPDDTFTRNALGVQWGLNPATRLNLTWEKQHRPSATIWTFQTQVRY